MDSVSIQRTRPTGVEIALVTRYAAAALALVGGLEWLLGRTISRLAAAPTLEGAPRQAIEVLGRTGLYLISPTALLAVAVLLLMTIRAGASAVQARDTSKLAVSLFLAVFGLIALTHTFYPTLLWLNVALNLLALAALWAVALLCLVERALSPALRLGVGLVAFAYSGWLYYVLQQSLVGTDTRLLGAPIFFLNLGEIAVVAAPAAFFAAIALPHRQWRHAVRWLLPAMLALLFSVGNIADGILNQGFMGVFAIWSLGVNLFLPWPLYALSGTLFVYALLTCLSGKGPRAPEANPSTGLGLLLLVFAGYALQLPFQFVMAALSIALLSGLAHLSPEPTISAARAVEAKAQEQAGNAPGTNLGR